MKKNTRKKLWICLGVMVAVVFISGCVRAKSIGNNQHSNQESSDESKGKDLTSFKATNLDGEIVDEKLFEKADLTMVNVWATFCGPCIREMPELGELNEEYKNQGVQVVGIVLDTLGNNGEIDEYMVETAKEIVKQTKANYVHLLPSEDLLNAGVEDIYSVPTTFFVDSKGNFVGNTYLGSKSKESWKEIIEQVKASM